MSMDYLKFRRELKLKGKPPANVKREAKTAKGVFFASQIAAAPAKCENCRESLRETKAINPAAIVAHIVPKSKFPSVATHPNNRMYLCDTCHGKYDNGSTKEIQAMNCFQVAVERLKTFVKLITEKRGLPKCFNGINLND